MLLDAGAVDDDNDDGNTPASVPRTDGHVSRPRVFTGPCTNSLAVARESWQPSLPRTVALDTNHGNNMNLFVQFLGV